MPWVSAGMAIGGAALNKMGSDKSAKAGKKTAKGLAKESKKAMEAANAESTAAYNEQAATATPWYDAGKQALSTLTEGISNGTYDPGKFHFDYASFEKDPGYQFRVDEGQRAMEQGAAARGKLLSGQQQKALQAYGQDMGSQEYQNAFGRGVQEWGMNADRLKNNYSMLNSLNMQGQQAGQNLAGYRGQLASARTGGIYQNSQNQMGSRQMIGDIAMSQGNQMASMGSNLMGMGLGNIMGPSAGNQGQGQPVQGNQYEYAPQKYVPFTNPQ